MYHRNPPTGWVDWEGPLRPRAFDLNKIDGAQASPWDAAGRPLQRQRQAALLARAAAHGTRWRATATATSCCSCTRAPAISICDYGHLAIQAGDYVVLPRGTMWRIESAAPMTALLIEATNGSYLLPDKGLVGPHAIFDPAMLDTPKIDDAFLQQQGDGTWKVRIKRRGAISHRHLPVQPAGRGGLEGRPGAGAHQRQGHPAADEPPLSSAAVGAHHLRRQPLRGLHLLPAPVRDPARRAEGAVLPQQRRLRRGAVLSRRRFLQPRQHQAGHGDVPSLRLHPRPASEGAEERVQVGQAPRPTNMR